MGFLNGPTKYSDNSPAPFFWAVKNNQPGSFKQLINRPRFTFNPNIRDTVGKNLLGHALERGHLEIAKILLKNENTDITHPFNNTTPFNYAFTHKYLSLFPLFIAKDENLARFAPPPTNITPLHLAAEALDLDVIHQLLDQGANPRAIAQYEATPLNQAAARYSHPNAAAAIELLLRGAGQWEDRLHPLNAAQFFTDRFSRPAQERIDTAYSSWQAAQNTHGPHHLTTREAFNRLRSAYLAYCTLHGASAHSLTIALFQRHRDCATYLLDLFAHLPPQQYRALVNQQAQSGSTALHAATYLGYRDIVGKLLQLGARTDIRAWTLFFYEGNTCVHDITPLQVAIEQGYDAIVEDLLRENAPSSNLRRPLCKATFRGHQHFSGLLLRHRGNVPYLLDVRSRKFINRI